MEYKQNVIEKEMEKETNPRKIEAKKLVLRLIEGKEDDKSLERCWNWRNDYGDIGIDITMRNRGRAVLNNW